MLSPSDLGKIQKLLDWQKQATQPLQTALGKTRRRSYARPLGGGDAMELAVMDEDIAFGETKNATKWDKRKDPPEATTETIAVKLNWWRNTTISAGKRIAYIKQGDVNAIHFAECEDPPDVQPEG